MMDVDFVQRIMREKSYPSEKISPPKSAINGKQRKFRSKYNQNNGKNGKDPRDLLASVNDQFNDPEYLNEIGLHLQEDIEKIKKEVIPLRERLNIYMNMEEKAENLPPEAVTLDVLDPHPIKNVDISQRANQLNITISELDSQLRTMQKYYCEKTKVDLKNDISIHQEKISDLNMKIGCMEEAMHLQNKQIEEIMNSKTREKIDHNNEEIGKLSFLLNEMKEEQKEDIDYHYSIICQKQEDPALKNQLSSLQRQLNSLQYIKAQRQVELNKQMKRFELQKKSVSAVIERNIQSSKNSSRNAKMSKRFTRELYGDNYSSKQSKNRVRSQHSSSSDYSIPENESENSYKYRIFKTNKNQVSEEQSDIYYLEDVEVQTKEIDFNSIFNNLRPSTGQRFRHHRRRIRKHLKREQEILVPPQKEDQNDDNNNEIEIDYNFPTNIQFLQFPSSSRNKDNNYKKESQITEAYFNTIDTSIENQNEVAEMKVNDDNHENRKYEIEFSFNNNNLCAQVDISNNVPEVVDSTLINFINTNQKSDQTENQQMLSVDISEIAKSKEFLENNADGKENIVQAQQENKDCILQNNKEANETEISLNDNENDVNNSGIRISASFAENALNILGHSKFVSDNEEEEHPEFHPTEINRNSDQDNNEEKKKEEILNAFNNYPRPRNASCLRIVRKAEYMPEVIISEEEEENDSKYDVNPFALGRTDLPCPSLSMKGACCMQTVDAGP